MATYIKPEAIKDASLPIGKVAAMSEDERLAFLVSLGLGKIGVVSQVQNWASDNSGYTISDVVRGFIPQEFITQAEVAGAVYNEATGYFEANTLVDLTYEDMQKIMIESGGKPLSITSTALFKKHTGNGRTILLPNYNEYITLYAAAASSLQAAFSQNTTIEAFILNSSNGIVRYLDYAFYNASRIKIVSVNAEKIDDISGCFRNCVSLQNAFLSKLKLSVSFDNSPLLTTESILYMINNAQSATITITLHKTAYARAMADAQIQAALEAHTNISLAQA